MKILKGNRSRNNLVECLFIQFIYFLNFMLMNTKLINSLRTYTAHNIPKFSYRLISLSFRFQIPVINIFTCFYFVFYSYLDH